LKISRRSRINVSASRIFSRAARASWKNFWISFSCSRTSISPAHFVSSIS